MHVLVDPPPNVLEDETGLRLAGPADGWRDRPDMDPGFTSWISTSCWGPVWTRSRSASRTSPPGCGSSRSTSPALIATT
jgi:hypothetical protein